MSAPQRLAHLGDMMRLTLGDLVCVPLPSRLRYPGLKHLALYYRHFDHHLRQFGA